MSSEARTTQALIDELVQSTGAADAPDAIRWRARALMRRFVEQFGEPETPIGIDVLASLQGIHRSEERPVQSPDAELVPDGQGGVTMRVNPDRPETRQRFSVAHEISHTFFPNYASKTWCRTDSRYRDRSNPDEYLEMLCDIGAAELLFPQPWFSQQADVVSDAAGLIALATTFQASREATLRRYAEMSSESLAAVFFTWKLKPSQKGVIGNTQQSNFLDITPEQELHEALRLRIEYSIASAAFRRDGLFLPPDKSVENDGPIYRAASTGLPVDEECFIDIGQSSGTYRVSAIPLWTGDDQLGSKGENTVAAVVRPLSIRRLPRRSTGVNAPTLFVD